MARSIRRDLFNRTEHRTHHVAGRLCFLFESDQECHREGSDPPNTESQKIKLKSHPVWLRFGGSKRCHLPIICLGKTRRNMGIINILIPIFRLAFYRETKWPKWTQMVNFSMVWRLPGRHRKRCDDVLGAKTGLQRGRPADTKHRNSNFGTIFGFFLGTISLFSEKTK